ncbi:hypothetical protein EC991_006583 [Linnemannia zychae]|nr:hypothetical protein EC991_006583 [Linnemannia zychae]
MNHRRQPDSHRWIYLHGFWCFLVCGLLVAGSSLAFVLGQQGALCQRIRDSRDLFKFSNGSSSSGAGSSSRGSSPADDLINLTAEFAGAAAASLPEYQDGMQYAPGQYCKNDYYMLDKTCAILGAIAAGMWLIDFCLIFGFCGMSGQYGPYRRNEHLGGRNGSRQSGGSGSGGGMGHHHQRRGQVGAEEYIIEEDYYPAGGHPPPMRYDGGGTTIYNEQDQYYYDLLEQQKRELEWRENRTLDDPKGHVQGPIPLSMQQSYFPTAYPNNVVQVVDTTTTPHEIVTSSSSCYVVYPPGPACYVFDSNQQEYLPSFVNMAARIEQKQHLKHSHSLSSSSHGSMPSTPAAVGVVASPGSPHYSASATPTASQSRRVMVTGLGMEAITRSSSEIEAERSYVASGISTGSTESLDGFNITPATGTPISPGLTSTPTAVGGGGKSLSRPQRIAMPSGGSYFPPATQAAGSPTGSLKSFTSHKSSDSHHSHHSGQYYQHSGPHHYLQHMHSHSHPHSPLGTEISHQANDANEDDDENEDVSQLPPQPQQQQQMPMAKKPSRLKRKTSRLTIITPQPQSPSSIHQPASAGSDGNDLYSPRTPHTPSPPRSPYVGDF